MTQRDALEPILAQAARGPVVVLTGAGVSAASGIPTFRGRDGLWTVGSREYTPQEMATYAFFRRQPATVWAWYLMRRRRCLAAVPNAAHTALVQLEAALRDRFVLVTQNVDDLHRRAGNSAERTFEIHGNLHWMRCAAGCCDTRWPVPAAAGSDDAGETLSAAAQEQLRCPQCGGWARPHVLWFDEVYEEVHYRSDSAWRAAGSGALLVIVGTSGATTLPRAMAELAVELCIPVVAVDPEDNPFTRLATQHGAHVRATAVDALPDLVQRLIAAAPPPGEARP